MPVKLLDNDFIMNSSFGSGIIARAYTLKFGMLNLSLNEESKTKIFRETDDEKFGWVCIKELVTNISKSNFVFSVDPPLKDNQLEDIKYCFHGTGHVELLTFLKLKVIIPQRRREEIYRSIFEKWKPEEFTIFFNGSLFFALSEINSLPISTDIGQISRELLSSAFFESKILEYSSIGPSCPRTE